MDPDPLSIVILVGLLFILWGISLVKAAFSAFVRMRRDELGETNNRSFQLIDTLSSDRQSISTTFQILQSINAMFIGVVITVIGWQLNLWLWLGWVFGIVLLMILGQIASHLIAVRACASIVAATASAILFVVRLMQPVSALDTLVNRVFGLPVIDQGIDSHDFYSYPLWQSFKHQYAIGDTHEIEMQMVQNIFELRDTVVREIMVPRIDMIAIDINTSLPTALDTIIEAGYSRIPVYAQNPDRIVGVLYAKDLLDCFRANQSNIPIGTLLRPVHFVPASKHVNELLQELQKRRVHIAIAVDEYGGTAGLVTIEDLLEEIVGDIQDEYDVEEAWIQHLGRQTYLLNPRLTIDEVSNVLGVRFDGQTSTLGGLIYTLAGRVPQQGEVVQSAEWRFTILVVEGHRIAQIRAEPVGKQSVQPDSVTALQHSSERDVLLNLSTTDS